jgi:hypothetical protein
MKKWIALALVVVVILAAYNRNRIFVRDPLGSVARNGAKEAGAQIYVNFSNDALIENDKPPMYVLLVQHDNHAGSPIELHCLHWLLCMTDADAATLTQPPPSVAIEEMTGKAIRFIDSDKRETVVALH